MSVAPHIVVGGHGVCFPALRVAASYCNPSPSNAHFPRLKPAAFARGRLQMRRAKQRDGPTCLFGGKGKQKDGDNDDAALWKSLEKSMDNLKKDKSIEGMLREQMQKQEFAGGDDGGGGGNFRGGDGSSGDSENEPEDVVDECTQVILASIGIICVYIYMLHGPELIRLFKDYIRYSFGGKMSVRLKRAQFDSGRFMHRLRKKEVVTKEKMHRELIYMILNTPTRWNQSWKVNEVAMRVIRQKKALTPDPIATYSAYSSSS